MPRKLNNDRRYSGPGPRPDNRKHRQDEAKGRQEAWSKLSPQEQLSALDARLGKGTGSAKQRARLQAKIDAPRVQEHLKGHAQAKTDEAFQKFGAQKAKERRAQERDERPGHS